MLHLDQIQALSTTESDVLSPLITVSLNHLRFKSVQPYQGHFNQRISLHCNCNTEESGKIMKHETGFGQIRLIAIIHFIALI